MPVNAYISLNIIFLVSIIDDPESFILLLYIFKDFWSSKKILGTVRIPRNYLHLCLYRLTIVILLNELIYIPTYVTPTLIQILTQAFTLFRQTPPIWVSFLKILLSNDIELNPGDFTNSFFTFCNWNVNSLAKDNFQRVDLIEAHNSLYKYDLISLCEVSINDTVEIPEKLLEDYSFIAKNNNTNTRHGGVGLFYKNTLPLTVRSDLGFNEALVVEINFGRKNIFFTVLYRSPANTNGSPEFEIFLQNFNELYTKIKSENPFAVFFTGDFNGHSEQWWPNGNSTPEGTKIEDCRTY